MSAKLHADTAACTHHTLFDDLIEKASRLGPVPYAFVWPCSTHALGGAVEAARRNVLTPILVGEKAQMKQVALASGLNLDGIRIVHETTEHEAVKRSVELIHSGEAQGLAKGSLHTDTFMQGIVARDGGLRTSRRMSHVFLVAARTHHHLILVSDAAINIAPDLTTKRHIIQNAIDLHQGLELGEPRVAILSAVETLNEKIPGTLDAACLCKMADRGEITGGLLDGPLAMDGAVSPEAAEIKGITSLVAGRAQILIAPNLEAGNILVKSLAFMGDAETAGLVLGARVPILLTSRADSVRARLASAAAGALYARHLQSKLN